MLYVHEFEVFESEGCFLAIPAPPLGGGTFGDTFDDAVESAVDWLTMTVDDMLMKGHEPVACSFGHKPENGGRMIAIAVVRNLGDIPAMTAADAARVLSVSSARVAQLIDAGLLESWKVGTRRMVSKASVEARMSESPTAGRPKKEAAKAQHRWSE